MTDTNQTSKQRVSISVEGSELMMELFNRMPVESLKAVPEPIQKRIGQFMVDNGYRFVFDRWFLQADPKAPERSADETSPRRMTRLEADKAHHAMERAFWRSVEIIDNGIDATREPTAFQDFVESLPEEPTGLAMQIEDAKKRMGAWPDDVRVALGLPLKASGR